MHLGDAPQNMPNDFDLFLPNKHQVKEVPEV